MKKKLSTILIVLVFLVGLSIMLYPTISNWYNQRVNSYAVGSYLEEMEDFTAAEFEALFQIARDYNDTLTGALDTFVSGEAEGEDYINALDIKDGMMGYLTIDKIDVYLPIYHGTDSVTLQTGIGHLEGSQLPTGDIGNNTVLTGHTGLPSADLLTKLTSMEIGDLFQVSVLDKVYTYQVFAITVVEPTETELLLPIEGKDVVTLVTCTPYGINSHRLLVQGEQIAVKDLSAVSDTDTTVDITVEKDWTDYLPYAVIVLLIILIILSIVRSLRLKDEIRATKEADKKEFKADQVNSLQSKFEKNEAKFKKREEKRIQKIEKQDMKTRMKYEKLDQKALAKMEKDKNKAENNRKRVD